MQKSPMTSGFVILEATPESLSPFTLLIVLSVGLMEISPFAELSPTEMTFSISCPRDVAFVSEDFGNFIYKD